MWEPSDDFNWLFRSMVAQPIASMLYVTSNIHKAIADHILESTKKKKD